MIKSKSEPSLFPPPASTPQAPARRGSVAGGGQAFHRVPSLGQLLDADGDPDALDLASDCIALTLPLHLLDVAAVKTVVDAADVFDVAHDFAPASAQAAAELQPSDVTLTDAAGLHDSLSHDTAVALPIDSDSAAASNPPRPLPPYIKPSVSLLPARVRASKGDLPPIPLPCLRLPWHLQLPPVVHTFTLKTEFPGKPGANTQTNSQCMNYLKPGLQMKCCCPSAGRELSVLPPLEPWCTTCLLPPLLTPRVPKSQARRTPPSLTLHTALHPSHLKLHPWLLKAASRYACASALFNSAPAPILSNSAPPPLNSAETCGVLLVSARRCTNYS